MYDVKVPGKTGKDFCEWHKSYSPKESPPCQAIIRDMFKTMGGWEVHPGRFGCVYLPAPCSFVCARGCECATKGIPMGGEVMIGDMYNPETEQWTTIGEQAQYLHHPFG